MTIDEKVRYGLIAISGASVLLATIGVHLGPLDARIANGAGDL
jgi:hypothetical protein